MFLFASMFQKARIKTISGQGIAQVDFVAFDPNQGKLVGLVFKKGFIQKQIFVLAPSNILEAGENQVIIRDEESIDPIEEIIRAYDIWRQNLDFFGLPAQTESGKKLGHLKDMLLDRQSFFIHRFYLRDISGERILSRDLAVGIKNRKLIFKDEAAIRPKFKPSEKEVKPSPAIA